MRIQRRGDDHHDVPLYEGAGRVGIEWYFRAVTELSTSVMLYHLEPGASEGAHLHLAGHPDSCSTISEDELYLVVAGEVVMTVGDESATLRTGDAVYVPEGVRHGVRNASDAPAELVLLFGPATGNPFREPAADAG
jgi:oxalate decarboxylase/phosphoglucose isomerase-like protein (cupin superfamily)